MAFFCASKSGAMRAAGKEEGRLYSNHTLNSPILGNESLILMIYTMDYSKFKYYIKKSP